MDSAAIAERVTDPDTDDTPDTDPAPAGEPAEQDTPEPAPTTTAE
jgi:hypothetical protein